MATFTDCPALRAAAEPSTMAKVMARADGFYAELQTTGGDPDEVAPSIGPYPSREAVAGALKASGFVPAPYGLWEHPAPPTNGSH